MMSLTAVEILDVLMGAITAQADADHHATHMNMEAAANAAGASDVAHLSLEESKRRVSSQANTDMFMTLEFSLAVVVGLTAFAAWINDRFFHLPGAIAALVAGGVYAALMGALQWWSFLSEDHIAVMVRGSEFQDLVLHGLLGFILFAAALQVDFRRLQAAKWTIFYLSTIGVVIFTLLWSGFGFLLLQGLHFIWPTEIQAIGWLAAMLFASLIAPTDAAAVLSILRRADAPDRLRMAIAGESLFNDAVSIVFFFVLARLYLAPENLSGGIVSLLLLQELGGGLVLGGVLGAIGIGMIRTCEDGTIRSLITFGLVLIGTCAAELMGVSGPLAMVVAGILVGEYGNLVARNQNGTTRAFWDVIDQALNGILFMLLGLELFLVEWSNWRVIFAAALCFPLMLVARYLSLWLPGKVMPRNKRWSHGQLVILTWCGMRGAVSVALALSLGRRDIVGGEIDPMHEAAFSEVYSSFILAAFVIVTLSMFGQGLTAGRALKRWATPANDIETKE